MAATEAKGVVAVSSSSDPLAPVQTPVTVPEDWRRPGVVVAAYNQKGGTGKSETTKGLLSALKRYEVPAVSIDLDPHGVLSAGLGLELVSSEANLANLLTGKWHGSILDLVVERHGLLIVPSSVDMALVEQDLASVRFREERLRNALAPLLERYSVLIDCPNNPGLLNDNALIATAAEPGRDEPNRRDGGLMVVLQLEGTSMHSLSLLLDQVDSLNAATRYRVKILGWVANLVDNRTNITKEKRNDLLELPIKPLGEVPVRAVIKNAWDAGKPIEDYDPRSLVPWFYTAVAHNLLRSIND
jgi:chromosome partitioning protein